MHDDSSVPNATGVAPPIQVAGAPTPFALAIAAQLTAHCHDPQLATRTNALSGSVAVSSHADPRAITITLDAGAIAVAAGAQPGADVHATLDLDEADPAFEPTIEGAEAHEELAAWLFEVLTPPATDWRAAARAFWTLNSARAAMPSSVLVTETESGEQLRLGADGDKPGYTLQAPAEVLESIFTGRSVLVEAAVMGKAQVHGTLAHMSVLTGGCIAMALGDDRR